VFPVKYELGLYIPEDGNIHSRRRENLKSYENFVCVPPELTLVDLLLNQISKLIMELIYSFETSVAFPEITRRSVKEDRTSNSGLEHVTVS
jgi:hypothetical protein